MNDHEIIELCGLMAVLWPSYRPPATREDVLATVNAWRPFLEDLEPAHVAAVVRRRAVDGGEFAPAVGAIRAAVIAANDHQAPDPDQAWREVVEAMQRCGHTATPTFTHPAVADAVAAMGGWAHMCQTCTIHTEVADRAHFTRFYENCARRRRRDATPTQDRQLLELLASTAKNLALEPGR